MKKQYFFRSYVPLLLRVFTCILFSGVSGTIATSCQAENTVSHWSMVLTRVHLPNDWKFFLDFHPRFALDSSGADGSAGPRQFLVRPALGYQFSDAWQVYAGYTLVENYNPHSTGHDSLQDALYSRVFDSGSFLQRFRAEQRFLQSDGEVAHRLRFFSQFTKKLSHQHGIAAVASNEIFINVNSVSPSLKQGFGENRAFVGLSFLLPGNAQLAAGYQNQYKEGRSGAADTFNHILLTSLIVTIDARGSEAER